MAEKRMFNRKVIEADAFMSLSHSCQTLYFHLCMNADDDGFLDNASGVIAQTKASQKDLDTLIESGFILHVSKYVYVIAHWFLNNNLQKDRFHPTLYALEKSLLVRPMNIWQFAEGVSPYTEIRPDQVKPDKKKKDIAEKKGYGSLCNVMLTDDEYRKLCEDLGKKVTDEKIEDMSLYIGDPKNAKKYSDHNLTIRRWKRREEKEKKPDQESFGDIADELDLPGWDIDL